MKKKNKLKEQVKEQEEEHFKATLLFEPVASL